MQAATPYTNQEYSLYTQELLSKPPVWMLRWGGSLVLCFILLLLLMTYLVKYPDVIHAKVIITTPVPPIAIIARQNGKLHWRKTPDDTSVEKGELVAVIESPAILADIMTLKQWLKNVDTDKSMPENLKLGEVQGSYARYQKIWNEYDYFQTVNSLPEKLRYVRLKQQQFQKIQQQLSKQYGIVRNEFNLINNNRLRYKKLKVKKLVSEAKVDEIEMRLLKNRRQQQQLSSEIARTQLSLTNLAVELADFKRQHQLKRQNYRLKRAAARSTLISALSSWEKNYVLKAPMNGKLSFTKFWSEHQFVRMNEEVVTVVPEGNQPIIARIKMPMANSGKVKTGQQLFIKLDGYPYQEYGQIESRIDSISLVPRQGVYTIEAKLPNPLKTRFNKILRFNQEMQGKAEIITEDMRLLQRILYQMMKIVKA